MIFFNRTIRYFVLVVTILLCPYISLSQESEVEAFKKEIQKISEKAIVNELRETRSNINEAGRSIGKDGRFMVSTDLLQFRDIDQQIIAKIEGRKKAINEIIWTLAERIEKRQDAGITFKNTQIELSKEQRETAERLNKAIRENNISISSLALAINMVVNILETVYSDAQTEDEPKRKFDLYIEYTAFVYEMSTIVVDLLDNFQQNGVPELKQLYSERVRQVDQIKGRIQNRKDLFKRRFEEKKINKEGLDKQIKKYNDWYQAVNASLEGWQSVFAILDSQNKWAVRIKGKVDTFRDLRDDSGLQLEILAELGITQAVLLSIRDIGNIVEIADVPLLRLDAEVAQELLGLKSQFNPEIPTKKKLTGK